MKIESVTLISAPLDQGIEVGGASWTQPVGLLSLATHLQRFFPDLKVQILDGEIYGKEDILYELDADLIGFSCTIGNYKNTLDIAKIAKEKAKFVIMGGAYTSSIGHNILRNREFIDAIVVGPGEIPLSTIVQHGFNRPIPNTWYRKHEEIVKGPALNRNMPITISDYSLINMTPYWLAYREKFKNRIFKRPITFPSQRGCSRKSSRNACIFCAIPNDQWQSITARDFWAAICSLKKKWNIDYVYETGDDFTFNKKWVFQLAENRPFDDVPKIEVCSRADNLSNGMVKALKEIGVFEVFVGIESGHNAGLMAINKGNNVKVNLDAARMLAKQGLLLYPGIILGVPGENEETMKKTISHLESLKNEVEVQRTICFVFTPLPGSLAFSRMMEIEKFRMKYQHLDIIDFENLQKEWVKQYCKVDFNTLREQMVQLTCL